ncbi:4a-hydroxytetrahydrobiopterin dehydratase [SAR202 cluster bacterium AD-802-E10_MRT_200m]|nr:4a-hydroxytetrahydrobiopterin dehydratase [SAR202 cluster bacterium AD-802-E10_MRT_200m]
MDSLQQQECVACRADSPKVSNEEINQLLPEIPQWTLDIEHPILQLRREFRFKNFSDALDFTNAIGLLAETSGHHPRIVTEWGRVNIAWWTHKIKGLHHNDFIMAARTDQAFACMQ